MNCPIKGHFGAKSAKKGQAMYLNQDEHYKAEIVLNSNLMIVPDFPHSIKM